MKNWNRSRLCYKRNFFGHGFHLIETAKNIVNSGSPQTYWEQGGNFTLELAELEYINACIATEIGDFQQSHTSFVGALEHLDKFTKEERACIVPEGYSTHLRRESFLGGIANSLNGLGRDIEAQDIYHKCLQYKPPNEVYSLYDINLARSYWAQGKLESAANRLTSFLEWRAALYGKDDTEDYLLVPVTSYLLIDEADRNRIWVQAPATPFLF